MLVRCLDSAKHMPTGSVFGEMENYWAEIAESNFREKQISFIKNIFAPNGLILDLACGTGRYSIRICEEGYDLVGLDLSRSLLKIAKRNALEKGVQCDFVRASMLFVPFKSNIFAGIMSLDTSFGYLADEGEDVKNLGEIRRTLINRGLFMLDVFNRDRLVQQFGQYTSLGYIFWFFLFRLFVRYPRFCGIIAGLFKWSELQTFRLLQHRTVNPKFNELRDLWLVKDKNTNRMRMFVHVVRLFGLPELQNLLKQALLVVEQVYGNYNAEEYLRSSNRLIIIAKKVH